jgi:class 3 adenylate cyclase
MLPYDVANTLKDGRKVEPKSYDNATIMFADVVDFSKISADCSPMQVVDMLNNIYNTFDNRLERYDVYKVGG